MRFGWPRLVPLTLLLALATWPAAAQEGKDKTLPEARAGKEAAPPAPCPDTMSALAGREEMVTCTCPEGAGAGGTVWGSDTYTADSATCRAAQHAGVLGRSGGTVTLRMLPGQARYPGTTRNGVQSQSYGSYGASFAFEGGQQAAAPAGPTELGQCPDNLSAFANSDERLRCSCPAAQLGSGTVWGSDTYTADSATCRAALHAGAISRQGGEVVVRMLPGEARYPGSTRNGVQSRNYGSYGASYRFEGVRQAQAPGGEPQPPAAPAGPTDLGQCPDNLAAFEGSDERLSCTCPEAVRMGTRTVWGTDVYTADSATCRAALHGGAISRQGGRVTLQMLPGQPRYPGTTRNGVQSQNYGAWRASYRFEGTRQAQAAAPAEPTAPTLCPDTLSAYANSDETLTCLCPGEATPRGTVWGTDLYTADSGTCRAAVHAGVIGQAGGTVTLQMLPGQPRYPGTTRNGVQSRDYGSYGASFRFQGGQRAQGNAPVQAPVAESLRRSGEVQLYVTFRTGSAELDIGAAPVLMQLRDAMLADPALRLRLVGHTDSTGSAAINLPLSVKRAEAVRLWLAQNGVSPDRLLAEGRGPSEPIADNASEAGRALNRRVQAVRLP